MNTPLIKNWAMLRWNSHNLSLVWMCYFHETAHATLIKLCCEYFSKLRHMSNIPSSIMKIGNQLTCVLLVSLSKKFIILPIWFRSKIYATTKRVNLLSNSRQENYIFFNVWDARPSKHTLWNSDFESYHLKLNFEDKQEKWCRACCSSTTVN